MPFIWNSSPNIPAANLPQPTGPTQISTEAHVVANTVEAGGTLRYNTAAVGFDVIYEVPTLNVGNLSVANLQGGVPPLLNVSPILYNVATGTVSHLSSGVTPGTYGGAAVVPALVVNVTGHISSLTNTTILLSGDNLLSNGNGSLFIGNTLTGRCDVRPITPGTGVLVNNDKGEITLVATGDPILSGHRYGSAWADRYPQIGASDGTVSWRGVAWSGKRFVAVGTTGTVGYSMISSDGITWTNKTVMGGTMNGIAFGNGIFVAVGDGGVAFYSNDGITWTATSAGVSSWNSVVWSGNQFVVVGLGALTLTSPDGVIWTQRSIVNGSWREVAYGGGIYVAVGDAVGGSGIRYSLDGITWLFATVDPHVFVGDINFRGVAYSSATGQFMAVGLDQSTNSVTETSSNGSTWVGVVGNIVCQTVEYGFGIWVAMPEASTTSFMTSVSGASWTTRTRPANGVSDMIHNGTIFSAVGSYVLSSTDGITWTDRNRLPVDRLVIAYGSGVFAAVGASDVLTSPDGFAWQLNTGVTGDWRSVAWNGSVFAAISVSGNVQTSPTGVSWTPRTGVAGTWNDVAAGGTLFAAVGLSNAVMTSPDGITWTPRSGASGNWFSIAWNGNIFASVGSSGAVMTSSDGITWTSRTGISGNWTGIAWNGAVFAAVGIGIVMTSPDGIHWTSRTTLGGSWISIEWNGSVFVAVGTNIVMTSPDGIHWTQRLNIPPGFWHDSAWNGNIFATVASSNSSASLIMGNQPDAVTSVARRTGAVVLNTDDVSENVFGPYYFTTARARASVGANTPILYDIDTGTFRHANSGITATTYGNAAFIPVTTVDVRGHVTSVVNTAIAITSSVISESAGGPFFHTAARVRGNVSNTAPINYDATTGIFSHALSGVTATTYGNTSFVPVTTVNSTGHVTSVVNTAIIITSNAVTATLTSDNAGANNLGAFLSVVGPTGGVTAPVTTDVYTNVCSMIVEAGDWDMEGSLELSVGATTAATRLTGGVSLTTNAIDLANAGGFMAYQTAAFVVSQKYIFPTGRRRISLSAATRVNLVGALTFTTLGGAAWGANSFLSARRTR